jgi:hypothetical protein
MQHNDFREAKCDGKFTDQNQFNDLPKMKKPGESPAFSFKPDKPGSDRQNLLRLQSLGALLYQESDLLAFLERSKTGALD